MRWRGPGLGPAGDTPRPARGYRWPGAASLVERLGLATAVVDVAVDLHSLFQHVIVPAIRGGATVMDDVFSDDEDDTDEGNERAENG